VFGAGIDVVGCIVIGGSGDELTGGVDSFDAGIDGSRDELTGGAGSFDAGIDGSEDELTGGVALGHFLGIFGILNFL